MISNNPVTSIPEYARDADPIYKPESLPLESQLHGVIPLDSLPAQTWNYLWGVISKQERNTVAAFNSIITEINNVLVEYGVTPSDAQTNQLKLALANAFATSIATSTTPGTVKSSSTDGQIGIDSEGVMSLNGYDTLNAAITDNASAVGDLTQLQTTNKNNTVGAINELKATKQDNIVTLSQDDFDTAYAEGTLESETFYAVPIPVALD